ncbi:copper resistance CopC family protein [Cellulomonas sp. PS-H5]|uniref:copper resistance CopC family protein n=1 Tax=Cellulomonas sp. PS-H5 TaxID=2820400 RepID=UPI001C500AA0|nr:copper resistance CopC family protein [Cellulomonas sp. PS-H5]MBW0255072.1 copper resistance protein CopC [Cellulomonas sp. PS-H5]
MIPSERPTPAPAPARPVRDVGRARVAAAPAPAPRAFAAVAALLLALAAVLLTAGRADAHNALQGTDPADGSTVDAPPARVTLTFDQPAQSLGTEIVVLGPDGSTVSEGTAELVDNTVSQALAADLPAGAYSVEWRVTSADGHPLSGTLAFTATSGSVTAVPAAPETIEPTAEPTMSTQAEEPSSEATVSATLAPQQELAEDEDAGVAAGVVAAIVVAVLAAGAVAVFVVRERRRSHGTGSAGGTDGSDGPTGSTGGDGRAEG